MSERRRRNRKLVKEEKRSVALANEFKNLNVQPKILLKTKNDTKCDNKASSSTTADMQGQSVGDIPTKTIIFTKSSQSPAQSPNITKETTQTFNNSEASRQNAIIEPIPQMTRPATIISSVGVILDSAKKLLLKSNTDFMVVGVVGTQGVGKSTILNLLANEQHDFDYYRKVFVEEDFIFPTKLKLNKCSSRSRTESTHMYITSDRLILLDTPPVMVNAYKKDTTHSELDDLTTIITLMSVCHLLIVVMDDYFNMNFLNIIRYAELMKRPQDVKPFLSNYYPNVLFVKNRAKRLDFTPDNQLFLDKILRALFKDSQLRIYSGQSADSVLTEVKEKKSRNAENKKPVNIFLFPEIDTENGTAYHPPLTDVVQQFRNTVFHTPRNQMYAGANELSEELWFEWLNEVPHNGDNFFFRTYEEIQRNYLDTTPGFNGIIGKDNSSPESWRDQ